MSPYYLPDYGESMIDQGYKFSLRERTDRAILKLKIKSLKEILSILRLEY